MLAIVSANIVTFHILARSDSIAAGCPIAFSSLGLGALLLILTGTWVYDAPTRGQRRSEAILVCVVMAVCAIAFPLAQMCCFGMTDYRRPTDAVVVFGARVYANGGLSQALADRVRTGCALYQEGLAHKIILSGGPGDGEIHETEGMRRMAIRFGVRAEDILVDEQGLNTRATYCLTALPLYMMREVAALWVYYARPLWAS